MSKAFIETTVLFAVTLAEDAERRRVRAFCRTFDKRLLPAYAVKELRSGPLKNFVWLHNKLLDTGSLAATLEWIQRNARWKPYTTATALGALVVALRAADGLTHPDLAKEYGRTATPDRTSADTARLAVKNRILSAWRNRHSIATEVIRPLRCYDDSPPSESRNGMLELARLACDVGESECSLADVIRDDPGLLEAMRDSVVDAGPKNNENKNRAKVLHRIARKPREKITPEMCRTLGDAVFVLLCPQDATILTTNTKDFDPLAKPQAKGVAKPPPVAEGSGSAS